MAACKRRKIARSAKMKFLEEIMPTVPKDFQRKSNISSLLNSILFWKDHLTNIEYCDTNIARTFDILYRVDLMVQTSEII